jgi:hypothetical protein
LTEWKKTPEGLKSTVLPKQQFPILLKKLFEVLKPNLKTNLQNGFKKCGVMPCSVEPVLERIARKELHDEVVSSAFLDFLKAQRTSCSNGAKTLTKRRKINVPPGKSVPHVQVCDELI